MARRSRRRTERTKKRSVKAKSARTKPVHDIVVLFADVVGCSEISNHMNIREYNEFINRFQECFKAVCAHYKEEEYEKNEYEYFRAEPRGDEGCLKIFIPNRDDLSRDIDNAIKIALDLKRKWLLGYDNKRRINNGQLPIDIGIGIHSGKVYVNEEKGQRGRIEYRPEGYTINLSKRIESDSRRGNFTRILLSEAARGELHTLKDEYTYRFDVPFTIKPKGIAHDIKVFEVKNHFLPTDWQNMPSEVSMIYDDIDDQKVKVAKNAYMINPMNLWLAEEYILLTIMNADKKLTRKGKEDDREAKKKAYGPALKVARQLANSDLRDAGTLGLLGFILGELGKYEEEQAAYGDGLKQDEQDDLLHWYLGYSISCELDEFRAKRRARDFYAEGEVKKKVCQILGAYDRAEDLRPYNVWNVYDYACELAWWSKAEKDFRKRAIEKLIGAFCLNSETMRWAKTDRYLKPIMDDAKVVKHLKS